MRANRRESKRRIQAQTRLLVQNKLVEQRNEFDNVFHSIRDGVITYDTCLLYTSDVYKRQACGSTGTDIELFSYFPVKLIPFW